jgi:methylmalonyl-CoA/ethylmalonyl-CoA epimerase
MSAPDADLPTGLAGLQYPITQISMAVRDMDALLERYYHAFGWAPWQVFAHRPPVHHATELRGQPVHYEMHGAEVYVGAMNFELLQPYEGPNLWSEVTDARGEGIASIATMFLERKDGDAVKVAFRDTFGIEVINRAEIGDHIEYYYLDTQERFGCLIESGSGHAIDFVRPARVFPSEDAQWVPSPASGLRYRIGQVTLVVRDLDARVKAYHEAFGWGPWRIYESEAGLIREATYRGRPVDLRLRWAQAKVGALTFEIVEPLGGSSPWQDYLDAGGEGLIGISLPMDSRADAERMRAQFAAEGVGVLASLSLGNGLDWFWLDSQDAYKTLIAAGVGSSFDGIKPTRTYPVGAR